ncbi:MAG: hypothetical protein KBB50_02935 [Candidatus Pacebacteria bacterium]|nr:hypothetical protein [Candidatus Paceibacterota bacterium]
MSFLVVAATGNPGPSFSEYPVISISNYTTDANRVVQWVGYYLAFMEVLDTCGGQSVYTGRQENPEDFKIGVCSFVKQEGVWYFRARPDDDSVLHRIVYGQNTLEAYGRGDIFVMNV